MAKGKGILSSFTLDDADASTLLEKFETKRQQLDEFALSYLEHRVTDPHVRERVEKILKKNQLKRGPKPTHNMSPRTVYEMIQAEKRVFGYKTVREAIESFCRLRGIPDYGLDHWLGKYEEGRKSIKKQGGNS